MALLEQHAAASRGSERVKEEAVWSRGASGDKGLTISQGTAVSQDEGWGPGEPEPKTPDLWEYCKRPGILRSEP